MKKRLLFLISLFLLLSSSQANAVQTGRTPTISKYVDQCIMMETVDTSVSNRICGKLIVPDGSLVNNGDGTWSLTFSSGAITTTDNITLDSDVNKLLLGDTQDASIYSDGTNMILDDINIAPVTLQSLADYKGGWAWENPVDTDDWQTVDYRQASEFDVILGAIFCETDTGSMDFDLEIAGVGVNGSDITCNSTGVLDATLGGVVAFNAGDKIDVNITSVTGTPGDVKIYWFGKKKN